MGLFSSGGSSRTLEDIIDSRFGSTSWAQDLPIGPVLEVLGHFPYIRDTIKSFMAIFLEGETLLSPEHKTARYNDAKIIFDGLGATPFYSEFFKGDLNAFVDRYQINHDVETRIKIEALIAFLPNIRILYDNVYNFMSAYNKKEQSEKDMCDNDEMQKGPIGTRYTKLNEAFNKIRTFPVDTIIDRQLLEY